MENHKSVWYNTDQIPNEMIKGAKAELEGFKKLENSEHFVILNKFIKMVMPSSLCDIGCGAGEISRVYPELDYLGLDLPHIIERVALVVNPGKKYISFDANTQEDFSFLTGYDLLVMNGFLSELETPIQLLEKIMSAYKGSIIIHRQDITDSEGFLEEYNSYGGLKTTNSQIGEKQLLDACKKNGYVITHTENSGIEDCEKKTLLIRFK
jgi:2-polyprenyl-3-methyl-5-hydroxy-6-metoxy-1,4-benzoquinol methylase